MQAGRNPRSQLRRLLPAIAILLIILTVQLLYVRGQRAIRGLTPVEGVLDITREDLSREVVNIVNSWDHYPGALYTSADFSAGGAALTQAAGDGERDETRYGTYRLVIKAPPQRYYSLCSYSIDYCTLVFVNGVEAASFGTVADNAEASVPRIGYMTIPLYSGETGEIEIIYQYANFVHQDGGFIQPTYLSTPQNIEEFKAGNDLVSLSLSGGLLVLFLYFLLCAAVQQRLDLLALAICCLMMALRDQNFLVIHAMPPGTSWYLAYRIFMAVTAFLPGMVLLLLASMYPHTVKKIPILVFATTMAIAVVLIAVLPTIWLVTVCTVTWCCAAVYLAFLGWGVIRYYLRRKVIRAADVMTVSGFTVLIASILLEALFVNNSSFVTRYGVMPCGMLIFVLLIAVAISLQVQAQAAALIESRSRGELLERMNAMNLDFLHQVAHELKTPLTVISGYAQLTGLQIAANSTSSETLENLKTIQQEALRLSDMVTKLMDYSHGQKSEARFGTVEVAPLLDSVRAICTPMCLKNGNRVIIQNGICADVFGNNEMLLQIFINLTVNANRHTQNGVITISASDTESREYVVFRVEDTGSGIDKELLPHVFDKGYSGDGGSGLGLAICREAVEAHGGMLEVERTGPEGTVFAFTVLRRELEP